MTKENNKYDLIVNMLKKSKPVFTDSETVTDNIMRQIQKEKASVSFTDLIIDYLFGWVYIGWVRRSMVAVTLIIAVLFVYQQGVILKRINNLSGRKIQNGDLLMTGFTEDIKNKMLIYRITGKKIQDEKITVSKKEIDEMLYSINKLQVKYRDLFRIIENDPQLKKYIEDRMNETNKN
jgi:hypothetical protein